MLRPRTDLLRHYANTIKTKNNSNHIDITVVFSLYFSLLFFGYYLYMMYIGIMYIYINYIVHRMIYYYTTEYFSILSILSCTYIYIRIRILYTFWKQYGISWWRRTRCTVIMRVIILLHIFHFVTAAPP